MQLDDSQVSERRGNMVCDVCGCVYRPSKTNSALQCCPRCDPNKGRERQRIKQHCYRDKYCHSHEEKGDLTIEQWIATLDYFNWRCAYCQEEPYEALEHFEAGGRTTQSNCVPSCINCNNAKGCYLWNYHLYRNLSEEVIERVRSYLSQFA